MRHLILVSILAWGTLLIADGKPPSAEREAVNRLKEIVRQIRAKASAADAEVQKMRREAKQITKDAEDEAAKIRAEAEEYTRKIEREIEEIQKNTPGYATATPPQGAPTREALSKSLASLVDPLLACWGQVGDVESCLSLKVKEKLRPYVGK